MPPGDDDAQEDLVGAAPRPLRADAQRNRDSVVDAASALVVELGAEVPLETVARAAGVGIATLYRRFPDRQSLLTAVVHDALTAVHQRIQEVLAQSPDPWSALTDALAWSPGLRVVLHLASARSTEIDAVLAGGEVRTLRTTIVGLLGTLLDDARADGAVRDDVTVADLVLVLSGVSRALPADDTLAEAAYARALRLVLTGVRRG